MSPWEKIQALIKVNAKHNKKGFRINEVKPDQVLKHALMEVDELRQDPDDIKEFADILGCLIHYAQIKGWTEKQVNSMIVEKLSLRFEEK